jgi:CHAT domain-containing protein
MTASTRAPLPLRLALCAALLACGASSTGTRAKALGSQEPQDNAPAPSDDLLAEANTLQLRALGFMNEGKYREAEPLAARSLELLRKRLGSKNLMVVPAMNRLGLVYMAKGDFARARPLFEEALAVCEELRVAGAPPVIHTSLSQSLNNLAILNRYEGNFPRAEQLLLRALSVSESTSGVESADAALAHANLSALYDEMGNFAQAEKSARSALAIRRKLFGEESVPVAGALGSLGMIRQDAGDYVGAEKLMREALAMRERLQGKEHLHVAHAAVTLASLYSTRGDYARAEDEYLRALNIFQGVHGGDDNVDVASVFSSLVALSVRRGDHDPVTEERILLRVLAIHRKVLGPEHPDVAISLNNLGMHYLREGRLAEAKEMSRQAGEIYAKAFGRGHPSYALALDHLGDVAQMEGNYAEALNLYRQSMSILEKAVGKEHPNVAGLLSDMAFAYWKMGEVVPAVDYLTRANDLRERYLGAILATGSEEQKRLYLQTLLSGTHAAISLHVLSWPDRPEAARLALTTILRRKGRVLDAVAGHIVALRQRAGENDRALLDRLSDVRTQLSSLVLRGPGQMELAQHRDLVEKLKADSEQLEAQVSAQGAELKLRLREPSVTVERVQRELPPGTALVELTTYRPYDLKARTVAQRYGVERYVAYVLQHEGEPHFVDLGDAAAIEAAVQEFRASLRRTSLPETRRAGRQLDELVMRPVRSLLGRSRRLLLSPEGQLNLIPFSALVDEGGRYLLEDYRISYLTSGRDLLRIKLRRPSSQPPIVFADPDFDLSSQDPASPTSVPAPALTPWAPLDGTAEVTSLFEKLFPGSHAFTHRQATEAALKRVAAPRILHIATHGFFDQMGSTQPAGSDNPLLRSGLVLAGANRLAGGSNEDGVLTALEASGLDLFGTKLVVLSACETGLGDVRSGEGVYGLRRALVLAGAESQVISLWKVNDDATRDIMTDYYKRLNAGEERAEALRQVQLKMLHSARQSHPYFWSGFIESGDWKNLEGR